MHQKARILYCHCRYAQVVPADVKTDVLRRLCESGQSFDAVADLCELAARRDPSLSRLAVGPVKIAACYPRAVKWLFAAAGAPLPSDQTQILNMRIDPAEGVAGALLQEELCPNLPPDKETTLPVESETPSPIA